MNAVLWQQRSVEYAASTLQVYRQATLALEEAVRSCDRKKNRLKGCVPVAMEQLKLRPAELSRMKAAVILDLDETQRRCEGRSTLIQSRLSSSIPRCRRPTRLGRLGWPITTTERPPLTRARRHGPMRRHSSRDG